MDRGGRPYFRPLDVYGQELSLYGGVGNKRYTAHNALERSLSGILRAVGVLTICQDVQQFAVVIPAGAQRAAYLRAAAGGDRAPGRPHGGVVSDLHTPSFAGRDGTSRNLNFDVKTFGYKPDEYHVRTAKTPAQVHGDAVPRQYELKCLAADERYCGCAHGVPGPLSALLETLGPVIGLAFGAYGEWSRQVDEFITDAAFVGSLVPEEFGCCHGTEQARGVIVSWARTRLARVSLREAAHVRIAALAATLGVGAADQRAGQGNERPDTTAVWDSSGESPVTAFPT
jgi:hypothetical protein